MPEVAPRFDLLGEVVLPAATRDALRFGGVPVLIVSPHA